MGEDKKRAEDHYERGYLMGLKTALAAVGDSTTAVEVRYKLLDLFVDAQRQDHYQRTPNYRRPKAPPQAARR